MFKYLVLGLVIILGVRADYCTPERCPPEGQLLFPNNSTCSSFSVCINGTPHFRNCPDGQLFHNPSQMCQQSNLVKCDCEDRIENIQKYETNISAPCAFKALREYEGAAANISERCIENSVTPVICPPDIGDDRLMVHPDDCRLFYVCETIGQKPVCRDCPADLHFNPKLKVCDHSWNAGCMSHLVRPLPVPLEEKRSFQPIPYKFPGLKKEDFNAAYKKRIPIRSDNNQCVQNSGPNADLRPNPEDCSKYYVCDGGHLISMSCPEGLHFNSVLKVCDLPQNARCQQNSTVAYVQEVVAQKEALKSIPFKLPKLQPEFKTAYEKSTPFRADNNQCVQNSGPNADLRPNPEDCSKYYVCDNGHLISMSCPEGLHFSTVFKVCDLPQNARCQQNSTAAYVQEVVAQKEALKSIPFKMPEHQPESNTTYEKRIFRADNNQCVQNSGPNADLRPNPEDCSKYYVCDGGHLISMSCPEGLHFNTVLKVCDLPQNARCQQNSTAAYVQEVVAQKEAIKSIPFKLPKLQPEFKTAYEKSAPFRADNQCVQNSGPNADLRPNPEDCSKYYVCDNGHLISMSCPEGLHFSTILKVCDLPQNARCQQNSSAAYVQEEPNTDSEKRIPFKAENNQCVQNSGPNADLRPNPEDCSKYYVCDNGHLISMSCPEGLHFSTILKVCDLPQNARCQQNSSAAYVQEEPNTDSEKRIPFRAENNQCVQNSGPYADLRPDPQDCGRYYVCDHGYLISMACPDGLHFSTVLKICDLPQNVRCQQNATEAYQAAVRNPKYVQISQEPKKLGKLVLPKEVIQCNAENGPLGSWADLRPDSENCSKYYVCDRGTVHSMSCPDGLHFCAASKVCDYPERAQCQASSIWDRLRRANDDSEENSSEGKDNSEERDKSEKSKNSEENSGSEEQSHKYLS